MVCSQSQTEKHTVYIIIMLNSMETGDHKYSIQGANPMPAKSMLFPCTKYILISCGIYYDYQHRILSTNGTRKHIRITEA